MEKQTDCAVVAEGGGQRGIYTAGVLDAFAGERFNPFDIGIGVSAGAQNLFAYFLDRPGYARRAIEKLTSEEGFFVPYRWLTRGNVIDLDGYFERTLSDPDYLLEYPRVDDVSLRRRLLLVATCRDSLEPRYLEPTAATALTCLKASSAVPLLYRSGVPFDGECLIDGGVADPLPVARAIETGARRLLVIRTVDERAQLSQLLQRVLRLRRVGALPSAVTRLIDRNAQAYREANAYLADLPRDVEVVQLRPSRPLLSQVFGSRSDELAADYATGFADGLSVMPRLTHWGGESHAAGSDPSLPTARVVRPFADEPSALPDSRVPG